VQDIRRRAEDGRHRETDEYTTGFWSAIVDETNVAYEAAVERSVENERRREESGSHKQSQENEKERAYRESIAEWWRAFNENVKRMEEEARVKPPVPPIAHPPAAQEVRSEKAAYVPLSSHRRAAPSSSNRSKRPVPYPPADERVVVREEKRKRDDTKRYVDAERVIQ
jgi:hypothetical protein